MPMNINGNWNGGSGLGFNMGLGKQKLFNIGLDLGGDYTRRVGFYNNDFEGGDTDINGRSSESHHACMNGRVVTDEDEVKSVTKSINLNTGLDFSYRKDQISVMLNGRLDYSRSKNDLNPMGNMNTYDFSYGAELEWTAPWCTSLSTDIGMSSRRGFLRGRALTVMLEVNDILGQQTNISRTIDALMRTDSRHNAIY